MLEWCFVLSFVFLPLVLLTVEEKAYNDLAAVYYMLLEQSSKGRLVARQPSLPTMLQALHIVLSLTPAPPSTIL